MPLKNKADVPHILLVASTSARLDDSPTITSPTEHKLRTELQCLIDNKYHGDQSPESRPSVNINVSIPLQVKASLEASLLEGISDSSPTLDTSQHCDRDSIIFESVSGIPLFPSNQNDVSQKTSPNSKHFLTDSLLAAHSDGQPLWSKIPRLCTIAQGNEWTYDQRLDYKASMTRLIPKSPDYGKGFKSWLTPMSYVSFNNSLKTIANTVSPQFRSSLKPTCDPNISLHQFEDSFGLSAQNPFPPRPIGFEGSLSNTSGLSALGDNKNRVAETPTNLAKLVIHSTPEQGFPRSRYSAIVPPNNREKPSDICPTFHDNARNSTTEQTTEEPDNYLNSDYPSHLLRGIESLLEEPAPVQADWHHHMDHSTTIDDTEDLGFQIDDTDGLYGVDPKLSGVQYWYSHSQPGAWMQEGNMPLGPQNYERDPMNWYEHSYWPSPIGSTPSEIPMQSQWPEALGVRIENESKEDAFLLPRNATRLASVVSASGLMRATPALLDLNCRPDNQSEKLNPESPKESNCDKDSRYSGDTGPSHLYLESQDESGHESKDEDLEDSSTGLAFKRESPAKTRSISWAAVVAKQKSESPASNHRSVTVAFKATGKKEYREDDSLTNHGGVSLFTMKGWGPAVALKISPKGKVKERKGRKPVD